MSVPTERQQRFKQGCLKGNMRRLADSADVYIAGIEETWGPINFNHRIYDAEEYRNLGGWILLPQEDVQAAHKRAKDTTCKTDVCLLQGGKPIMEKDIEAMIWAGTEFSMWGIGTPIDEEVGKWVQRDGDMDAIPSVEDIPIDHNWFAYWTDVAVRYKENKNTSRESRPRVPDEVWDRLTAIYLKMLEIQLAHPELRDPQQ